MVENIEKKLVRGFSVTETEPIVQPGPTTTTTTTKATETTTRPTETTEPTTEQTEEPSDE